MCSATVAAKLEEVQPDAVFRPMVNIQFWHPRKSVIATKQVDLLPGYVLVRWEPVTRDHVTMLRYADGILGEVTDQEVHELRVRSESGDFDMILSRSQPVFAPRDRVKVSLLARCGEVIKVTKQLIDVLLDGRDERVVHVRSPFTGLVLET